jgi:flavodoxin I
MEKIALIYGPKGGSVEKVARMIREKVGDRVDLIPVDEATIDDINRYENIIFGLSTVGADEWTMDNNKDPWSGILTNLDKIDYLGKTFALFGLGNQVMYPKHFVDAMGILGRELLRHGARIVGQQPVGDYDFEESLAVIDDHFIGLPLDEDTEPEKTPGRLDKWLEVILKEFDQA